MTVAVEKRFEQESIYGLPAGTKKVAVVERWRLAEVRLYLLDMQLIVKNIYIARLPLTLLPEISL